MTITTVARHANVSRQTVSNVLNTPELVRAETRRRVRAAIEELGYRTNLAARQMRTGRSRLLAARIDPVHNGIEGVVLDRFLHGLAEAAAPAGYRVVLFAAADDRAEISTYDELLASYALDAFVLTHTHRGDSRTSWLLERRIPFVTFGRSWGAPERHSWVDVDGAAGTAAATRHLIAAGHRRIGFLGWPPGSGVGDDRQQGWASAMAEAGLTTTGLDHHTVDGFAEGTLAARTVLSRKRPPTAFVCASDPLAMGARQAGEVAVIGFDDTAMAQATGLSTVRQPLAEVAAECVRILAGQLGDHAASGPTIAQSPSNPVADQAPSGIPADGLGTPPRHVLLAPDLVIRSSG